MVGKKIGKNMDLEEESILDGVSKNETELIERGRRLARNSPEKE